MIGAHPTVGCTVFMRGVPTEQTKDQVLQALGALIPPEGWRRLPHGETDHGWALTGDVYSGALLWAGQADRDPDTAYAELAFDEDQLVHLARRTGVSLSELLAPYMALLQTVPGSYAVAVGFEVSPPEGLDDDCLRQAGVAVWLARDDETMTWRRRELLPMVGHYL